MGFFDSLFDKREKIDYYQIKRNFYFVATSQRLKFPEQFGSINAERYRADIVAVFAAYMDTKEKFKHIYATYGEDIIDEWDRNTEIIDFDTKGITIPACRKAYKQYGQIISTKLNNHVNATNVDILAKAICDAHHVKADAAKLNAISMDIQVMVDIIDATFEKFRFV